MLIEIKTKSGVISVMNEKPYIDETVCKHCGHKIFWALTANGKKMPVEIIEECFKFDFVCHFDVCKPKPLK